MDAEGAEDVGRLKRTAKSCGSDVAVLASRSGEAKLLWDNGGKRAVLRGEHEVSRKAIAQGRPECFPLPCMLVCNLLCANRTRDRGCSKHPVFPAPSDWRAEVLWSKTRAENAARSPTHIRIVITRLVRNCALGPRSTGCPAFAGHDSFVGWVERSDTHRSSVHCQ